MKLLTINTIKSFADLNKGIWTQCWEYWYSKEYIHCGIREYLEEEIAKIKKEKETLHILDAGCGSSWVAKYYMHLFETYTGLDFNEELINQLKKDYSGRNDCSFTIHDIESNEKYMAAQPFNLILANFLLLELTNLDIFFKKSANAQNKGDYLIVLGLDPINEIVRNSVDQIELEQNLDNYRHADYPVVVKKNMSFNGDRTNLEYLRILYSVKDILGASSGFYELIDLDDKLNLHSDSYEDPLYYAIKFRKK